MNWQGYKRPESIAAALDMLKQAGGRGRVFAGGTDLIPQLRQGDKFADLLVDITGIKELQLIHEQEDWICIGAAVTHAAVATHPLICQEVRALAEGCARVGSPQIRNMATLAGNVINALPAADGAIPLTALAAEINIVSPAGERWIPIEDTYRGVGLSHIDPSCEIVKAVRFKKPGNRAMTGFFRMARRKTLTKPIINGAVYILWDQSFTKIEKARIALGPVADRPFHPQQAERLLENGSLTPELILEVARQAAEEASPRTNIVRGSDLYRKEMIRIYLARTLHSLRAG